MRRLTPCPHFQRGRIGCAYYNPVNFLIYVLEDTQETAHFDVTKTCLSFKKIFRVFLTFSVGASRSVGPSLARRVSGQL
jgi:hypothetical protein